MDKINEFIKNVEEELRAYEVIPGPARILSLVDKGYNEGIQAAREAMQRVLSSMKEDPKRVSTLFMPAMQYATCGWMKKARRKLLPDISWRENAPGR